MEGGFLQSPVTLIIDHLFCSASLVFTPVNAEIESISFDGPDSPEIDVISADYNLVSLTYHITYLHVYYLLF